jgi:ribonucleoside-diphosphate reductase alpha chain
MDAFGIAISVSLQHGVPLSMFVKQYTNMRFEPAGMTDDPDIRFASSLLDYIFRRLAIDYLPFEERMELGILAVNERLEPTLPGIEEQASAQATASGIDTEPSVPVATESVDLMPKPFDAPPVSDRLEKAFAPSSSTRPANADAPYCMTCGVQMIRAGSCHACPSCGSTSGCS